MQCSHKSIALHDREKAKTGRHVHHVMQRNLQHSTPQTPPHKKHTSHRKWCLHHKNTGSKKFNAVTSTGCRTGCRTVVQKIHIHMYKCTWLECVSTVPFSCDPSSGCWIMSWTLFHSSGIVRNPHLPLSDSSWEQKKYKKNAILLYFEKPFKWAYFLNDLFFGSYAL